MKPLTLEKAVELNHILQDHIPSYDDKQDALHFIGKIVDNIKLSNRHNDYIDAVVLMSGQDWEEIKFLDSGEILRLFIDGLSVNRIVTLKSFCDLMGLNNG